MNDSFLRRYEGTDFITSLRALAATLVIIIHTGAFSEFGELGKNITLSGKNGVNIFFVISGFAIASTLSQGEGYRNFLLRRVMRIAPTYYFAIILFAISLHNGLYENFWKDYYNAELDAYNITMHLLFLSMFDYRIANSIIGIEWTIPIEVFWYLLFPMLVFISTSRRKIISVFVALLVLDAISQAASSALSVRSTWLPFSYGWQFYLGFIAFHIRRTIAPTRYHTAMSAGFAACFCLALALNLNSAVVVLSLAAFISTFRQNPESAYTRILCSRPIIFLGTISYSSYLFHMAFVQISQSYFGFSDGVLVFALTFLMTTIAAAISYRALELPSNTFGRNMVQNLRNKSGLRTH